MHESLDIVCFRALQLKIVQLYFGKLYWAWDKYNMYPNDCYNMDETSNQIRLGGKQKIETRNAPHQAFASSLTNHDYVTVVECVSPDCNILPFFVILPRKNILEAWPINTDMPYDICISVSDTGYQNDSLCLHWLKLF
jgi:hypothetical protein